MTEQNKKNQRPDAIPVSLSVGAVEAKYKKGDHVWAKQPKELAGRTGYVMEIDTRRMEYEVRFGTEIWIVQESDLELVDPATEEARQPVFEREDDADQPRKASWKDNAVKTIDRLISWMIYSMTFCFLLGVAGLDMSEREIIAYSLMLGLVVGSINNIERVIRELFKKED